MFAAFAALTAGWFLALRRSHSATHRIHYFMLVLVAFKALTLLSQVRTISSRFRFAGCVGYLE